MKLLSRTPLLLLAAIGLTSSALLLMSAKAPPKQSGDIHLLIKTINLTSDAAVKKFDDALGNENRYTITYDPPPANHWKHKGKLKDPCPVNVVHLNTNVTQQMSFKSTDELKTFLESAF